MSSNDKNKIFSEYEEPAFYDLDKVFGEGYIEFEEAFDKMQCLQEKDISARILKAEKLLEKIEHELTEFLNV